MRRQIKLPRTNPRKKDGKPPARRSLARMLAGLADITYEVATAADPLAGRVLYVSPQVRKATGRSPAEFIRDPGLWLRLVHPDDVASVAEATGVMHQRRKPQTRLYRLRHKATGAYRWFEDRVVPRIDSAGRVVGLVGAVRDVTERIETEERLRFQSDVLRNVRNSVIVTDLEGRITYWNEGATGVFGYGPEEALGRTPAFLYPDQDPEGFAADLSRIFDGIDYVGEWLGRRKDGSQVWVDIRTTLLRDREGRPMGFLGVSEDVTERRSRQEQLRFSEEQFRTFFLNVPGPAYLWRRVGDDFELLTHNIASTSYTEGRVGALLGRRLREIYAERPDIVADMGRCLVEQSVLMRQMTYRFSTGKVADLVVRYVPIAPDTVVMHTEDVTERERAGRELRESEERYRTLFETATDAVFITTRSGRLLDVNQAAAELWGGSRDELLRLNVTEVYADPRDREQFVREVERQGTLKNLEVKARRRDGTVRDCLVSGSVRRAADGTVIGYQGVAHDITGQKRAADMVRASRDGLRALAVELHKAREEERAAIAREIHDEFGQVLTGLTMDLMWLLDHQAAGQDAQRERVGAMMALVDRTMEAVRRMATDLRPAVLDELGVSAAIEWLSADFEKHSGIKCVCKSPTTEPPLSPDRAIAVFRITQEALTNIARHSGAQHVMIAFTATDEGVGLEVRDDGKGITEGQVASVRSIGLIGMRERAGSLGGRVYVRPGIDRGTIVTLHMPFAGSGLPAGGP